MNVVLEIHPPLAQAVKVTPIAAGAAYEMLYEAED